MIKYSGMYPSVTVHSRKTYNNIGAQKAGSSFHLIKA
jgi:hypothetical protein